MAMPDVDETVKKIKNLEIQGAQSIAKESLKVLSKIVEEEGFGEKFDGAAERLKNARPTGVSAHNTIDFVKRKGEIEAIDATLDYLNTAKHEAGRLAADKVEDESVILTHCHSSAVMATFEALIDRDKDFRVIVTETEPKLQGVKTAKELHEMGIPVNYIVDAAAGLYMWAADYVFVGVDSVKPSGVLNKIGTYLLSVAAEEDPDTEFWFIATKDKFDYDNFSDLEERSPDEIEEHEHLEKEHELVLENPAFDMTPWSKIDKFITEDGEMKKHEIIEELKGSFSLQ
ncbi:MAG: translation initiation factor eIF-2B [Candidatus Aenigmatarchaeota archaeon]